MKVLQRKNLAKSDRRRKGEANVAPCALVVDVKESGITARTVKHLDDYAGLSVTRDIPELGLQVHDLVLERPVPHLCRQITASAYALGTFADVITSGNAAEDRNTHFIARQDAPEFDIRFGDMFVIRPDDSGSLIRHVPITADVLRQYVSASDLISPLAYTRRWHAGDEDLERRERESLRDRARHRLQVI